MQNSKRYSMHLGIGQTNYGDLKILKYMIGLNRVVLKL